ncbi:Tyrosine-protein phosphatase non-receptor type 6 [Podila clonocystis]|nr:Tyrosine-protein phosphatase non-receptor type 6 [Podila clonocystis]KAG0027405.1 Tyrosine-protein phosphatase non-receptor type 6 [Podila clonocystis]
MSRLPGFLRLDCATTARAAVEAQHQLFAQLNSIERQRAQAAFTPSSPFSVLHAVQDSTREQNRYTDILPYRHSQVLVGNNSSTAISPQNFINANRISAPAKLRSSLPDNWRSYIATQAPLPQTQSRFWRMILEQNVHVIVCLTAVSTERSRRAQKAERYWPMPGETDEFEKDIKVRNLETGNHSDQIVAYHQFEVWNAASDEPRRLVLLVHYQGWPDHGVPQTSNDIRGMLYRIREWKQDQEQRLSLQGTRMDFGPTVVHCSAGCGRTGTFCVVDTALAVLEHTGYPHLKSWGTGSHSQAENVQQCTLSRAATDDQYNWQGNRDIIFESLDSFREERMMMVQTAPQFSFCYQTVRELCN